MNSEKKEDELAHSLITKAFGGCTLCYGKGYATQRQTISGGRGRSRIYEVLEPMIFCSCDRGNQLKKHIDRIRKETLTLKKK